MITDVIIALQNNFPSENFIANGIFISFGNQETSFIYGGVDDATLITTVTNYMTSSGYTVGT